MTKTPTLRPGKELHWRTLWMALATAFLFFIPYIITSQGYFLFYGDFNVQQIPFYQMCHQMVRTGQIGWNWYTDLGANFVGSYTFYLLGSPFFWLTLPFPNSFVPHLMGPLLILKFGLSAFTAYFYLRRFTKTPEAASLGALLYAFSGFSVYNIFFNHFHEALVFFPLLLLGVELFLAENRRGPLLFATFICALSNYFFFFGMAVFCILYWFLRTWMGKWNLSVKRFLCFLLEIVLGVGLAAVLLAPTFYSVMQMGRVSEFSLGWSALLYGKEQIYLNVIEVFFFPPDLPARPVYFTGSTVQWSSLGGWMPVFGMTCVIAWLQSKKGNWLRRLIIVLFVMSMVPILNSAFYMFNSAYYARWFYMAVLMMALATVLTLEDDTVDFRRGFRWAAVITALFTLVIGFFPSKQNEDGSFSYGLFTDGYSSSTYTLRFWTSCGIAILCLVLTWFLMKLRTRHFRRFMNCAVLSVCIVSVFYAAVFIGGGKTHGYDDQAVTIDQLLENTVSLPDDTDNHYRIDVYDGVDNTGMSLGYPCIQAFHSIVSASITNFYTYIGVERGVGSRPETDVYAIRPLLSVRYLMDSDVGKAFASAAGTTEMPGWTYYDTQSGYEIYENDNYIPYGFTYDYYMTEAECEQYEGNDRASLMLKAILLSEDAINRNNDILTDLADDYSIGASTGSLAAKTGKKELVLDQYTMAYNAADRAATACTDFVGTTHGFTANADLERENLVFFSIPYEENGWTAYVDGVETRIEVANVGFMAVRVPAGQHQIEFRYHTPGGTLGIAISCGALVLTAIYLLAVFFLRKKAPNRFCVAYPEREELEARPDPYRWEELPQEPETSPEAAGSPIPVAETELPPVDEAPVLYPPATVKPNETIPPTDEVEIPGMDAAQDSTAGAEDAPGSDSDDNSRSEG